MYSQKKKFNTRVSSQIHYHRKFTERTMYSQKKKIHTKEKSQTVSHARKTNQNQIPNLQSRLIFNFIYSYTNYTITNRNRIIESKSSKSQNREGTHTFFWAMHREDFDLGYQPEDKRREDFDFGNQREELPTD